MPPQQLPTFTTRPVIRGTFGVVAAGHYLAAAIGMHVLESGGNAIDAGVAAGFALNLVKPQSNGIGGEAPILIYRARRRPRARIVAINGQGSAPAAGDDRLVPGAGHRPDPGDGLLPATVPAAFGAWVTALMRYGRLGLKETLGPVVDMARGGFAVYAALRDAARAQRREVPPAVAVLGRGLPRRGQGPGVGWILRQPTWARTFEGAIDVEIRERGRGREAALQAALDYFYRGPVAEKLAPSRARPRCSTSAAAPTAA